MTANDVVADEIARADEKVGNDDDEERGEPLEFGGNKLPMKLPLTRWMKQLPMMPRNPTLPLG